MLIKEGLLKIRNRKLFNVITLFINQSRGFFVYTLYALEVPLIHAVNNDPAKYYGPFTVVPLVQYIFKRIFTTIDCLTISLIYNMVNVTSETLNGNALFRYCAQKSQNILSGR